RRASNPRRERAMTQHGSQRPKSRGLRSRAFARPDRGFTLIELMVVIVILGLLIGLVVPNVWSALTSSTKDTAMAQMKNLSDAVSMYYLENRSLPQSLDDLTQVNPKTDQKYIDRLPLDPWKQSYEYKVVNPKTKEFQILSSGEDKTWGTDDDLVFPPRDTGK